MAAKRILETKRNVKQNETIFTQDGHLVPKYLFDQIRRSILDHYENYKDDGNVVNCHDFLWNIFKNRFGLQSNSRLMKTLMDFLVKSESIAMASDLTNCSIHSLLRPFTSNPSPFLPRDRVQDYVDGGFTNAVNLMAETAMVQSYGVRFSFNAEVKTIYWNLNCSESNEINKLAFVRLKNGGFIKGKHLLVTVPVGVLKHNNGIDFIPQLPKDKLEALENIRFGCVHKVFLKFHQQFWPSGVDNFAIIWRDDLDLDNSTADWIKSGVGFKVAPNFPNVLTIL